MKKSNDILCVLLLAIALVPACSAAATITATNPVDAAQLVYVSGYEMDPGVFYPYESGTITVSVTNAANASVVVSPPDLIEPHIKVKNLDTFNTKTTIGPGATVSYTFDVEVDANDGNYYPLFTLAPVAFGGNPIHSTLTLKVDSADAQAAISQKPDIFSLSKKSSVNVTVINPRDDDIINAFIVASSEGADVFPQKKYLGTIPANSKVDATFQITPNKVDSEVLFNVTFDNGDNHRHTSTVLPLNIGADKIGAEVVVNNIESSSSGMTQTLKGDVTNNGLTDAKSVLVTVGSPAKPVNPNPVYAIGNLEPDDFSSFELSYIMTGNGSVPLIIEYKDAEGNLFHKQFDLTLSENMLFPGSGSVSGASAGAASQRRGMFGSFGSGLTQVPVTEIAIILVAIVALLIAWRKGLLRRLANRFRKDPLPENDDNEPEDE